METSLEIGGRYFIRATKNDGTIGQWEIVVENIKVSKSGQTLIIGKKVGTEEYATIYQSRIIEIEAFESVDLNYGL